MSNVFNIGAILLIALFGIVIDGQYKITIKMLCYLWVIIGMVLVLGNLGFITINV